MASMAELNNTPLPGFTETNTESIKTCELPQTDCPSIDVAMEVASVEAEIASDSTNGNAPLPNGDQVTNPTGDEPVVNATPVTTVSAVVTPMYSVTQHGEVISGPGALILTSMAAILNGTLPKINSDQQSAVSKAKKYAMDQSIRMVLMKQTLAHQQQQMASQRTQVQRQQALALMCRLYVGSISFELKEETIRQAFLPFGPIKSINMSWDPATQKHKGFAFVEYEIPEAAQLALEQMNGVMLGGRNIKVVGRPSNMPQAQAVIDEIQDEAKRYNRVYVAAIHADVIESEIKNVFEAFGPILSCKLAQAMIGTRHKGYGFIEYESAQAAQEAIASMNLFDLGGQYLRVGKAITPPNALQGPSANTGALPTAAAVAAAAATARIQAIDAVATNTMALTMSKLNPVASLNPISLLPGLASSLAAPGLAGITGATAGGFIPPPGIALPTPAVHVQPVIIPPPTVVVPSTLGQPVISAPVVVNPPVLITPTVNNSAPVAVNENFLKRAQEQAQQKQQEELQKKLMDENEPQTLQQQENMSIKGQNARHLVMQKLMRKMETRVVILRNMVGPEDVDETLQEEIQDECSKYGVVDKVIIYNEKQSDDVDDDAEVIVKIFVEFSQPAEAEAARDGLNRRYFGGRLVNAQLYEQTLFDHNDLSA